MSETKNKITNALNIYTPLLRENLKKTFPAANNISVKGGSFNFNSETGVANFIIDSADNFVINNQTVSGASISGADVTFDNGTANISISGADNFVINNQTVTGASISGADVTFDSGTANISIGSADNFVINNQTVSGASISGADVTFDSGTANISISGGAVTLNGAEVNNITVTGTGVVTADGKNATLSIQTGSVQKLSPNLTLSPASILFNNSNPNAVTLSANSSSDAILDFYADNDYVSVEELTADKCIVSPILYGAGTSNVYCVSPENADYFGQYKVVPVTLNFSPIIDFYVEDSQIKSVSDTVWQTQSDVYVGDSFASVDNNCYFYTEATGNADFSASDFTILYKYTQLGNNSQYAGPLSAYQNTNYSTGFGLHTDGGGTFCWITDTSRSYDARVGGISKGNEVLLKIVRNGTDFKIFVNGVQQTSITMSTNPISKANDLVVLGQSLVSLNMQTLIKSFSVFNFAF